MRCTVWTVLAFGLISIGCGNNDKKGTSNDTESGSQRDTDTDSYHDTDADTPTDTDSDTDVATGTNGDTDAATGTDGDTDAATVTDGDTDAATDAEGDIDTDTVSDLVHYPGTVFYVSNAGSDDNDGLGGTPDRAWRTIAHVNAQTFSPGDAVLFKRGDTWREMLQIGSSGSADAYISFGAYGDGQPARLQIR